MTEPDIDTEEVQPIDVIIKNPSPQKLVVTDWETKDEWDIITMSEEDIKEAEEARNA